MWNFIITEPNWLITTLISSVFGALILPIFSLLRYAFRLRKRHWLNGEWFHYFINFSEKSIVFGEERMIIKRGLKYSIVYKRTPIHGLASSYTGHVEFEKGFLLLKSSAIDDNEQIFQRFPLVGLSENQTMVGLASAQDYNGRSSVNPCAMSRKKLSRSDFDALIKARINVDSGHRIMSVRN